MGTFWSGSFKACGVPHRFVVAGAAPSFDGGKLLADASKQRSRFAVILGAELAEGRVQLKDLASGEQRQVALGDLASALRAAGA
jgi:histidyl-tRNA synthetase